MSRSLAYFKSSAEYLFRPRSQRFQAHDCLRGSHGAGVNGVLLRPKRYAATAAASQSIGAQQSPEYDGVDNWDANGREASSSSILYPKKRRKTDPRPVVEHLKRLFPPLEFPDEVALQMLTHKSATDAWAGHNDRLAFIGRRVLHSYTVLFLQSASLQLSRTSPSSIDHTLPFDFDQLAYRATFTHLLGEHVGNQWNLADVMLWTPPLPRKGYTAVEELTKSPGLYKVQGTTVEGIMGGIFHQFGGSVAQRVFHTRVLPYILCPGTPFGLHDAFHHAARELQAKMGGPSGLVLPSSEAKSAQQSKRAVSSSQPKSSFMFEERESRPSVELGQEKKRVLL